MRRHIVFWVSCIAAVIIDRWLKILALGGTEANFLFGKFILFKNSALVFSWPAPNTIAIGLVIAAMSVVGILLWRAWRRHNFWQMGAYLLIFLGAFSNLYDRLVHGFVIDWGYLGPWWPVFNLADVMVVAGVIFIIVIGSKSKGVDKKTITR